MVGDAFYAAQTFGNSLLLLDRYFLSVPALEMLSRLNKSQDGYLEIITKAKKSCIGYKDPKPRGKRRGHPPKKGTLSSSWVCSHPVPGILTAPACPRGKNFIRSCVLYWLNITGYGVSLPAQIYHFLPGKS